MRQFYPRVAPHPAEVWERIVNTMLKCTPQPSNKEVFAKAEAVVREYTQRWESELAAPEAIKFNELKVKPKAVA